MKFFNVIWVIFLIIIGLSFYLLYKIKTISDDLNLLQNSRYETRLAADMLRQSSDDLTRFARQYAITGEKKFKDDFERIVHIRDGQLPLPKNYQNLYWDLSRDLRDKNHPDGKKISFEQIVKNLAFDKHELKLLSEAKQNSDDLVNIEIEAFSAMAGLYKDENGNYSKHDKPDQQKAIGILHSDEYFKAKEKIMQPIDALLEHHESRTSKEISDYKYSAQSIDLAIRALFVSMAVFFVLFVITVRKKILSPIIYLTEVISSYRVKKIVDKKIFYDDEIGFMTEEFFKLTYQIKKDMKIINKNKRDIEEYIKLVDKHVITSTTDLNGVITYVSEAFAQISGFTKEELLGKNHRIVKDPNTPKEIYVDLWKTIGEDKKWHGELRNRAKEGTYYWVDATIYPNYDDAGIKIGYTAVRVDITAKKQVEALLDASKLNEQKIQQYVELVDKNIITSSTDISGKITYVSEAFARISGYNKDELIGKTHRVVKHEDNEPALYENMWETISNNRIWHGVIKNRKKDGGYYWVDATIYPTFNQFGEKTGYTAIRIDITDKKKIEDMLITDALTEIYNRRYFNEVMPRAINMAKRDKKYFSFIIMDIDHFKQYNDIYGHQKGDDALKNVAAAIKDSLHRASDMCFRLGGEEFGVIFEALDTNEAYRFAENIRKNIEALQIEHRGNSASKYVTVSLGLTTKKIIKNVHEDELYKEADDFLYKAKESGRNRVETNI